MEYQIIVMTDYDILGSSLVLAKLSCETKAYDDQSKSAEKNRYETISSFWNCVCEGGSCNGKSGEEAVFVYS